MQGENGAFGLMADREIVNRIAKNCVACNRVGVTSNRLCGDYFCEECLRRIYHGNKTCPKCQSPIDYSNLANG